MSGGWRPSTRGRTDPVAQWGTAGEYVGRISANCHLDRLRFLLTGLAVEGNSCLYWYWDANSCFYLDEFRIDEFGKMAQQAGVSGFCLAWMDEMGRD